MIIFFQFQQSDGRILDRYVPDPKDMEVGYKYFYFPLVPGYAGHKNIVETNQKTSLIQAVAKYIKFTGGKTILTEIIASKTI